MGQRLIITMFAEPNPDSATDAALTSLRDTKALKCATPCAYQDSIVLANCYYHWSAYTTSAAKTTIDIMEKLEQSKHHWSAYTTSAAKTTIDIMEKLEQSKRSNVTTAVQQLCRAIHALMDTGATFDPEEKQKTLTILHMLYDIAYPDEPDAAHDINNLMIALNNDTKDVDRVDGMIAVTNDAIVENANWSEGDVSISVDDNTCNFGVIWYLEPNEYDVDDYDEDDLKNPTKLPVDLNDDLDLDDMRRFHDALDMSSIYVTPNGEKYASIE